MHCLLISSHLCKYQRNAVAVENSSSTFQTLAAVHTTPPHISLKIVCNLEFVGLVDN